MQRVSSNSTIFYKFFVPIFWLVFFGALTLVLLFDDSPTYGDFSGSTLRILMVLFYLSGLAMFYFLLFPLKRVEMDDEFCYVTNYFKTYRYPWHNIAEIQASGFWLFNLTTIILKTPGQFGKNIRFLASRRHYHAFWKNHPDLAALADLEKQNPKQP